MITGFIVYFLGVVIMIPWTILYVLDAALPAFIYQFISDAWQYTAVLNGDFPMYADSRMTGFVSHYGLVDLFMFAIAFLFNVWTIKLVFKIISITPWIKLDMFDFNAITNSRTVGGKIYDGVPRKIWWSKTSSSSIRNRKLK